MVHVNIVSFASFSAHPYTVRDKFVEPTDSVLGVTTDWRDRITKGLKFAPTGDYETGSKVVKQKYWPTGEPNDITIGLNFHFMETVYENQYRKFTDILSLFGGLLASLCALLWALAPFATLYFLFHLISIIMDKITRQYRSELNNLMASAVQQLRKIRLLAKNNAEFEFIDKEL